MKQRLKAPTSVKAFDRVKTVALELPDVEATTKYVLSWLSSRAGASVAHRPTRIEGPAVRVMDTHRGEGAKASVRTPRRLSLENAAVFIQPSELR